MSFLKLTVAVLTVSATAGLGTASQALAQATFADKAIQQLDRTSWVSAQTGRKISFWIKDGNAQFEDEVEPNLKLIGAYRQDNFGAGYVFHYEQGYECRYNMTFLGSEGDELSLRLVTASAAPGSPPRFRCVEGLLKRTAWRG
jgi:hypothetical protein